MLQTFQIIQLVFGGLMILAIGILLVAFPPAHGIILTALYLPVFVMLIGLILRGVSFEFRAKAPVQQKAFWNACFFTGSLLASLSQGFMLGMYVMGLTWTLPHVAFATLTAVFLSVGYSFIGAAWLIAKTDGLLQEKAVGWAKGGIWGLLLGIAAISLATPFISERIFDKWFGFPQLFYLAPFPLLSGALLFYLWRKLHRLPMVQDRFAWTPFAATMALFALSFGGMAYSFYPYVIPETLTIYDAAAAPESLIIILVGTLFVLPTILAYQVVSISLYQQIDPCLFVFELFRNIR